MKDGRVAKRQKPALVQEATAKLRELILTREPETQIGSLNEVAQMLGVGIVTVQQAARILEHEGLLAVRRGPGGGYYGIRPDEAALQRSLAAYMRVHGFGYREALEMISLLDCEIIPAAALCRDPDLRKAMEALSKRLDHCDTDEQRIACETELRKLLYKMVSRPLVEFLTGVTGNLYKREASDPIFPGDEGVAAWKTSKRRIVQAILAGDAELSRFEAERYRQQVLVRLRASTE
ncbi:MAG: GntR-family transcriptional regulator [Hydrocarboniphaga sp.]|nr:GntR-family transcriptional regulator [Hydrocarboniphaga sp.]